VDERVEDCPPPSGTIGFRHYAGDGVYELRLAGDLYPVGVPEKGDDQAPDHRGVRNVADVVYEPPGYSLVPPWSPLIPRPLPHVPLIEVEVYTLLCPPLRPAPLRGSWRRR
jgi:hypothetical protein